LRREHRRQKFSPEHKIHILLNILNHVSQYRSAEFAILKYVNDINLREFIEKPNKAWIKVAEFLGDSLIMRSIIKLLRYHEKNTEHIINLCKDLLVVAKAELKIKHKQRDLLRKFTFRMTFLALISGFSLGTLIAIFSYIPIAALFGHNFSVMSYMMLIFVIMASTFISLHKASIYSSLFVTSSTPIHTRRIILILLTSLITSFLLSFLLIH